MPLPGSRNTTYGPTDPLKSADLNALQDCIIGAKHGPLTLALDVADWYPKSGTALYDGTAIRINANATEVDIPVPLNLGDRITAVTFFFSRDSGTTLTFALYERNTDGTAPTLVCSKNYNAAAGNQNTEIGTSPTSGSLPKTFAANKTYFVRMSANNTDDLYAVFVAYDRT